MFRLLSQYWWVAVVRGVIAILFGVLAFTLPMQTLAALVLVFGAFALVDGVFTVAAAISGRKMTPDWWIMLLQGLVGIGVGMLTWFNPAITAVVLLVYIAFWAVFVGVLQLFAAVKLRHEIVGEWWLALGGILGVAFGLLLLWRPAAGALTVLWLIATFAIVWGVVLMIGGFGVHRLGKHAVA
jgi:uncharacterized membrane protein HdeD (DUF308 family)